ncbi:hypothetical protein EYC84_005448 [Monilinia fructicola]|uniref:Uncharacterized protein n=1 Tax=Monilinia fructicola TaxID=38448 RepID=A0A5M9JZG2_MONFR|nr:hypothetical protein EYC84_005448 [Monilinia fructicola]
MFMVFSCSAAAAMAAVSREAVPETIGRSPLRTCFLTFLVFGLSSVSIALVLCVLVYRVPLNGDVLQQVRLPVEQQQESGYSHHPSHHPSRGLAPPLPYPQHSILARHHEIILGICLDVLDGKSSNPWVHGTWE